MPRTIRPIYTTQPWNNPPPPEEQYRAITEEQLRPLLGQVYRPETPAYNPDYFYEPQPESRATKQLTKSYFKLEFHAELGIDEDTNDYALISLYEGQNEIGKIYTNAITPNMHFITKYNNFLSIKNPDPEYTVKDLLPRLMDKLSEYEHIEHLMVEIYKAAVLPHRSEQTYAEHGFVKIFENSYKIIMLYEF